MTPYYQDDAVTMKVKADMEHDLALIRSLVARGRYDAAAAVARGIAGYLSPPPRPASPAMFHPLTDARMCRNGHPQTIENTYGKAGGRRCRLCNRENQRRFDLRKYGKRRPHRGDEE